MVNSIRTTALLALMTGLFMAVGFMLGGQIGILIALGFAALTNFYAYWNSANLVLRMHNATELDHHNAPDIFTMVAHLCQRAQLPMPALYLIETEQPNAFATGRNPENAAIAISRGLLELLDYDEIEGVVAHELAHIQNRDILTMTVAATFAAAISMLANFALFFGGSRNNSPFGLIGVLLTAFFAPLAALLVRSAVSRTREYEADHDGAEISGNPIALARALTKISKLTKNFENKRAKRHPATAHMFIINPLFGSKMDNLFATHPRVENRVAELMELAKTEQNVTTKKKPSRKIHTPQRKRSGSHVPSVKRSQPQDKGPWD